MTSLLVPIALTTDSRARVADHRRRSSSGVCGALRGDVRQSWRPLEVGRNGRGAGRACFLRRTRTPPPPGCGGCHFPDDRIAAIAGERRHVGLAPEAAAPAAGVERLQGAAQWKREVTSHRTGPLQPCARALALEDRNAMAHSTDFPSAQPSDVALREGCAPLNGTGGTTPRG
jgi:hypothetical protein